MTARPDSVDELSKGVEELRACDTTDADRASGAACADAGRRTWADHAATTADGGTSLGGQHGDIYSA